MAAYTLVADVLTMLPATLPSGVTLAHQTRWITDASAIVDSLVGQRFPMLSTHQKFADAPSAPPMIEVCARWMAAYFGFIELREINQSGTLPGQATSYHKMALDALEGIRKGEIDIYSSAGVDLGSTETMWSTTLDRDATFSRGVYVDGVREGDAGSLDDFGFDENE